MQQQQTWPLSSKFEIALLDDPWPCPTHLEQEIEEVWKISQKRCGERLFNGRMLALLRIANDRIVARPATYKLWLAQVERPKLRAQIGVVSLGVRGVITARNRVLFAKRAPNTSVYGGMWECAPGGNLPDPNFRTHLVSELKEETGITSFKQMRPFAAVWNHHSPAIDICCQIACAEETLHHPLQAVHGEYTEYRWLPQGEWPEGELVPTTQTIVENAWSTSSSPV